MSHNADKAKDLKWICRVRRLRFSFLIAVLSFLFIFIVSVLVDLYYSNDLIRRTESLKIGMTEQQLFQIMGTPAFSITLNVNEMTSIGFIATPIPEEVRKQHHKVVEYGFASKRLPGSRGALYRGGIYLDENHTHIVMIGHVTGIMDFFVPIGERLASLGFLIILVLIPVVGFQLWCKNKMKNQESRTPNSDISAE
jgi:hypothetical protein